MEVARKPVRDATARQIMKEIETYEKMPFAKKMAHEKNFPAIKVETILKATATSRRSTRLPALGRKSSRIGEPSRTHDSRYRQRLQSSDQNARLNESFDYCQRQALKKTRKAASFKSRSCSKNSARLRTPN